MEFLSWPVESLMVVISATWPYCGRYVGGASALFSAGDRAVVGSFALFCVSWLKMRGLTSLRQHVARSLTSSIVLLHRRGCHPRHILKYSVSRVASRRGRKHGDPLPMAAAQGI